MKCISINKKCGKNCTKSGNFLCADSQKCYIENKTIDENKKAILIKSNNSIELVSKENSEIKKILKKEFYTDMRQDMKIYAKNDSLLENKFNSQEGIPDKKINLLASSIMQEDVYGSIIVVPNKKEISVENIIKNLKLWKRNDIYISFNLKRNFDPFDVEKYNSEYLLCKKYFDGHELLFRFSEFLIQKYQKKTNIPKTLSKKALLELTNYPDPKQRLSYWLLHYNSINVYVENIEDILQQHKSNPEKLWIMLYRKYIDNTYQMNYDKLNDSIISLIKYVYY